MYRPVGNQASPMFAGAEKATPGRLHFMDTLLILIIDNDIALVKTLADFFSRQGYQVKTATDGLEGLALWQMIRPNLVISALDLPRADGLDILDFRNMEFQRTPLLLLTESDTAKAEIALRQGAHDYFIKPVKLDYVLKSLEEALQLQRDREPLFRAEELPKDTLVGSSPFMHSLRQNIELAGSGKGDMLITGEAGTGKSLLVRYIHKQSPRPETPCIGIDCAGREEKELKNLLFGNPRQKHSGEQEGNVFSLAKDGLLYLREITALSPDLQARLFHALETGTLFLPESENALKIRTRIIASSSRDLETMVTNNLFHAGLYARLKSFHFALQPLRNRGRDLFELIAYFLDYFSAQHGKVAPPFSARVLKKFLRYPWPGNVGELRNVLERMILTCEQEAISNKNLPRKIRKWAAKKTHPAKLPSLPGEEKLQIIATLEAAGWNQSESARRLGMTRNTLRYRMKKYNIQARPRQSSHA